MLTVFQCITMEGWTQILYYVSSGSHTDLNTELTADIDTASATVSTSVAISLPSDGIV